MPTPETNTRKIISRLQADGWVNEGGANHDLFHHPSKPGVVVIPRHRTLSPGIGRSIAKAAGWL